MLYVASIYLLVFLTSVFCGSRKVLLRDVESLTLSADVFASSRKGYNLPQLACVGGSAFKYPAYHPHVAQCYNKGSDGYDVQWECKATLDNSVKFGHLDVNCEGYDYPEDKYILHGSCALRYHLDFVNEKPGRVFEKFKKSVETNRHTTIIVILIIVGVLIWYFCLRPGLQTDSPYSTDYPPDPPPSYFDATSNNRGSSFGHDDSDDSGYYARRRRPPQPSAPPSHGWNVHSPHTSTRRPKCRTDQSDSTNSSWIPNMMSAGAGFLGGYFMGSRSNAYNEPCASSSYMPRPSTSYSNSESTSFRDRSPQSSSTSVSSGFGGTSRR